MNADTLLTGAVRIAGSSGLTVEQQIAADRDYWRKRALDAEKEMRDLMPRVEVVRDTWRGHGDPAQTTYEFPADVVMRAMQKLAVEQYEGLCDLCKEIERGDLG